jgi:hypothetical protein
MTFEECRLRLRIMRCAVIGSQSVILLLSFGHLSGGLRWAMVATASTIIVTQAARLFSEAKP